jgi:hypothetical protein
MGKMLALWFEGAVPDASVVLRASGRLIPRAFVAFLLVHLIEAVAAIGLLVGTLLVIPLLSVTSPVIGIENLSAVAAVRRSWSLTRRHYRRTCAFVLFAASIVLPARFVVRLVAVDHRRRSSATTAMAGWSWGSRR